MCFGWFSFSLCMCICVSDSVCVCVCMCANGIAAPNGVRVFKWKTKLHTNSTMKWCIHNAGIFSWHQSGLKAKPIQNVIVRYIFFHPFDRCASCLSALRAWVWDILMLKRVMFDRHIQWSKLHLSTACLAALLSVFCFDLVKLKVCRYMVSRTIRIIGASEPTHQCDGKLNLSRANWMTKSWIRRIILSVCGDMNRLSTAHH